MRTVALALLLAAPVFAGCISGTDEALAPSAGVDSIFSDTAVFPGVYDTTGPYSRPLTEGIYDIVEPEVVELASDVDGVTIQLGIVRPDVPAGTRVPVLLVASPYFDPMTPDRIRENPRNEQITFWNFDHYDYFVNSFVPHGYAVVFLATRGTGNSGGCWTLFGADEQADVDQAITWLGAQEWSNGNVGMTGISFEGTTQWMAAATGNPHLKTIVPIVGSQTDVYELAVKNGSVVAFGALIWPWFPAYGLGIDTLALATDPTSAANLWLLDGRNPDRRVQGAACPEVAKGIAATAHADLLLAPDPTGFWAERNFRDPVASNYRGSVFIVNGLHDFFPYQTYPFVTELESRGIVVKHLLGQWDHAYPDYRIFRGETAASALTGVSDEATKRWDFAEILRRWLDHQLKGEAGVDVGPGAQVQDNLGLWRNEITWPPPDRAPMRLNLGPDGALTGEEVRAEGAVRVGSGSADACPCPRFATEPVASELRFAGLPVLHLDVTPSGPGGHVAARVYVDARGDEQLVGQGQIDLRVAEGPGTAKPVVPGQRLMAQMQLLPTDVVVPEGGRLIVELSQGAVAAFVPSTPTYPIDVAVGGERSTLTIHTFEPTRDAFFVPPG